MNAGEAWEPSRDDTSEQERVRAGSPGRAERRGIQRANAGCRAVSAWWRSRIRRRAAEQARSEMVPGEKDSRALGREVEVVVVSSPNPAAGTPRALAAGSTGCARSRCADGGGGGRAIAARATRVARNPIPEPALEPQFKRWVAAAFGVWGAALVRLCSHSFRGGGTGRRCWVRRRKAAEYGRTVDRLTFVGRRDPAFAELRTGLSGEPRITRRCR